MRKILLLALLLFVLTAECYYLLRPRMVGWDSPSGIGMFDFQYYATAFQVFKRGENPYDVQKTAVKTAAAQGGPEKQMNFLYPPWLLVLLAPILNLPAAAAAPLWFGLNLLFLVSAGVLVWRAILPQQELGFTRFWLIALFAPVFEAVQWGQVNILVLLGVSVFFWAYLRKRDWLAGAISPVMALKPHLLILAGVFLIWQIIREKRYRIFAAAAIAFFLLFAICVYIVPGIVYYWLDSAGRAAGESEVFRNAVFADFLQQLLLSCFYLTVPGLAFGILVFCIVILLALLMKQGDAAGFTTFFPGLLCLSVFFAPYGWFHDQSLLLVTQVALGALCERSSAEQAVKNKILLALATLQIATVVLGLTILHGQHSFFWFPLAMFLIWRWGIARL